MHHSFHDFPTIWCSLNDNKNDAGEGSGDELFSEIFFGDSKDFAGYMIEIKTKGMCQRNGATPAGWCVMHHNIASSQMQGPQSKFVTPISGVNLDLTTVLFVNNTDIIQINMNQDETICSTHEALQHSVLSWGQLQAVNSSQKNAFSILFHSYGGKMAHNNMCTITKKTQCQSKFPCHMAPKC